MKEEEKIAEKLTYDTDIDTTNIDRKRIQYIGRLQSKGVSSEIAESAYNLNIFKDSITGDEYDANIATKLANVLRLGFTPTELVDQDFDYDTYSTAYASGITNKEDAQYVVSKSVVQSDFQAIAELIDKDILVNDAVDRVDGINFVGANSDVPEEYRNNLTDLLKDPAKSVGKQFAEDRIATIKTIIDELGGDISEAETLIDAVSTDVNADTADITARANSVSSIDSFGSDLTNVQNLVDAANDLDYSFDSTDINNRANAVKSIVSTFNASDISNVQVFIDAANDVSKSVDTGDLLNEIRTARCRIPRR